MATHTLIHVSDPHLLASGLLFDAVDCEQNLGRFVDRVIASGVRADAVVVTGDVADQAEPAAYGTARRLLDPLGEALSCPVVWVMGNHDQRARFRELLLGDALAGADRDRFEPNNHLVTVGGLRIVALDSTLPGYHHGRLGPVTLEWLREVLAQPAEHGTVLALHHPPLETSMAFLGFLDLRDRAELAEVVRGTDVRAVLAGHWHVPAAGSVAGVPVLVAGATSYSPDPGAELGSFVGVDSGQGYRLVELWGTRASGSVTSTVVPLRAPGEVTSVSAAVLGAADALDPAVRDEQWSRFPVTDPDPVQG